MKLLKIADVQICNTSVAINDVASNRCPNIFKKYFWINSNQYKIRTKKQMTVPPSKLSLGYQDVIINSYPPGQNSRNFADDIFVCFFVNEKCYILIKISLKFVSKGPIDNKPT